MTKHILITGASGFLGSELTKQLLKNSSFSITLLTTNKEKLAKKYAQHNKVEIFDWSELSTAIDFKKYSIVVHCAFSRSFDGESLANSLDFTKNLLDTIKNRNIGFINISSRSVYGQNENTPWKENTPVQPNGVYALAKYASEVLVNAYSNSFFVTNLRLAGLNQPELEARITNKFVAQVKQNKNLKVVGGEQEFSFLNTKDAASGIISFIENLPKEKWQRSYNLGSKETLSITQLAQLVIDEGKKQGFTSSALEVEATDAQLIDRMDSSLFYKMANWEPAYSMQKTVIEIFSQSES